MRVSVIEDLVEGEDAKGGTAALRVALACRQHRRVVMLK